MGDTDTITTKIKESSLESQEVFLDTLNEGKILQRIKERLIRENSTILSDFGDHIDHSDFDSHVDTIAY